MTAIIDKLQKGVQLHQSGQYDAAREEYLEVLQTDENNADAIHLLGVLDMQSGDNVKALERLLRASELQPGAVNILSNLGSAQRRLGKFEDALATYQKAISLDPAHAECYHNMGVALRAQKRNDEAVICFRKAIELRPNYVEAIRNLTAIEIENGNWQQAMHSSQLAANANPADLPAHLKLAECQMKLKQFPDAIVAFRKVLEIDATQTVALNGLGLALKATGELEQAKETLEKVLQLDPNSFPALANLGTVLQGMKKIDLAIEMYRRALTVKEDSAEAHNNLGGALKEKGLMDESLQHCRRAIEIKPELASAHCNLAAVSQLSGEFDAALKGYEKAIALQGDLIEAHLGIGSAYAQMGKLKEARKCYSRALFHNPKHAESRLYRGIIGLLDGDLENAWSDYEWRFETTESKRRKIAAPRWDGSNLNGKPILLHAEQGLGDTIQFMRYGKLIHQQKGGRVVIECQKALLPLLSRVPWIDQLVAQGEQLPAFTTHVPMMSLPGVFCTTMENIPDEIPYLSADPDLVEKWNSPIGDLPGLKVGIAWQGNPDFKQDKLRSIPLKEFAPLFDLPDLSIVSLQKGFGSEQIENFVHADRLVTFENVDTDEGAFMDTAALLHHLGTVRK